jgi:hypothetical protein
MKKVLLVLVALVLVVSGVAMVSAYEAHLSNVKVHVENALVLQSYKCDFGTVFPEEWKLRLNAIRTSTSFCAQERMNGINFTVWVEKKLLSDNGTPDDPSDDTYYPWLGDALYLKIGGNGPTYQANQMHRVGNGTPPINTGLTGAVGHGWVPGYEGLPIGRNLWIGLDVPVFEGYYNPATDVKPKPSGLNEPTVVINVTDEERYFPDGVTLGADIKIQVTAIY